jgi:hypothetical protein
MMRIENISKNSVNRLENPINLLPKLPHECPELDCKICLKELRAIEILSYPSPFALDYSQTPNQFKKLVFSKSAIKESVEKILLDRNAKMQERKGFEEIRYANRKMELERKLIRHRWILIILGFLGSQVIIELIFRTLWQN